jgi:hypothetical protein
MFGKNGVIANGSGPVGLAAGKWEITRSGYVHHVASGIMLAAESFNPDLLVPYQAVLRSKTANPEVSIHSSRK